MLGIGRKTTLMVMKIIKKILYFKKK